MRSWLPVVAALLLICSPARAFWWGQTSQSVWLDHDLQIDGDGADWKAQAEPVDDAYGVAFAFSNDERDLYVLAIPHTDMTKNQFQGTYGQDFTLWLDPSGGTRKAVGFRIHPPSGARMERRVEIVAGPGAPPLPAVDETAQLAMGAVMDRGAFEAQIPLAYFGGKRPAKVTVAIETSLPAVTPAPLKHAPSAWSQQQNAPVPGQSQGQGQNQPGTEALAMAAKNGLQAMAGQPKQQAQPEEFSPIGFWIRVTLARKPAAP